MAVTLYIFEGEKPVGSIALAMCHPGYDAEPPFGNPPGFEISPYFSLDADEQFYQCILDCKENAAHTAMIEDALKKNYFVKPSEDYRNTRLGTYNSAFNTPIIGDEIVGFYISLFANLRFRKEQNDPSTDCTEKFLQDLKDFRQRLVPLIPAEQQRIAEARARLAAQEDKKEVTAQRQPAQKAHEPAGSTLPQQDFAAKQPAIEPARTANTLSPLARLSAQRNSQRNSSIAHPLMQRQSATHTTNDPAAEKAMREADEQARVRGEDPAHPKPLTLVDVNGLANQLGVEHTDSTTKAAMREADEQARRNGADSGLLPILKFVDISDHKKKRMSPLKIGLIIFGVLTLLALTTLFLVATHGLGAPILSALVFHHVGILAGVTGLVAGMSKAALIICTAISSAFLAIAGVSFLIVGVRAGYKAFNSWLSHREDLAAQAGYKKTDGDVLHMTEDESLIASGVLGSSTTGVAPSKSDDTYLSPIGLNRRSNARTLATAAGSTATVTEPVDATPFVLGPG